METVKLEPKFTVSYADGKWWAHREKSPVFLLGGASASEAASQAQMALDWYDANEPANPSPQQQEMK